MKTVDNSFKPPIEKCLGYWYEGMKEQNRAELYRFYVGSAQIRLYNACLISLCPARAEC